MAQSRPLHPLRRWRVSRGLTLDRAADLIGTVRQVWSDWERGRRRPGSDAMGEIYRVTDGAVTPNDFYDLPKLDAERDAA